MLTREEALRIVLDRVQPLAPRNLTLADARGRVTAVDVVATEDVPPFTNSAMDGFAVRAEDCAETTTERPVRLRLLGDLPAGRMTEDQVTAGTAFRIMTGAAIPPGADAVVRVEDTRFEAETVEILTAVRPGANVRRAGEDVRSGSIAVPRGAVLRPAELALLAAIGHPQIAVHPAARVAVITTGDELVDAAERPGAGQIRDANIHSLTAQVEACGACAIAFPRVPDRAESVRAVLTQAIASADAVVTNGGVSVGAYDFIKDVLRDLGAALVFWGVAQKPGMPLAFWEIRERPVFGVPGNPVSAVVCFDEYVRPALRRMMGYRLLFRPEREGILDEPIDKGSNDGRVHFMRVIATPRDGRLRVRRTGPQGSGILTSLQRANAIALFPADARRLDVGATVVLHMIDEAEDH